MRGHLSREEIVGRSDRDSGCWHVHLKSTEFTGVWCRGVEVISNIEAMITSGDYDDEAVVQDGLFRDVLALFPGPLNISFAYLINQRLRSRVWLRGGNTCILLRIPPKILEQNF